MIGKNEWLIPDGFMNPTKNGDFESPPYTLRMLTR